MANFVHILVVAMFIGAANVAIAQNETTAAPEETTTAAPVPPETTTAAPVPPETTTAAPVPPETTMAAPVATTYAPEGGLTVECTRDYMKAVLDVSLHTTLLLDGMTLEDDSCTIESSNSTHVSFTTGLDKCGTKHNTTDKYIIYYNAIVSNTKGSNDSDIISRDFQASFPFQCSFPRRKILSVTSFSPRRKVVYTKAAEFGNFTFVMDMYKTDAYKDVVDSYPHEVNLGSPLYIKTEVKSKDSKLVLFIRNAKATPTSDYNSKVAYQFITDGCYDDSTMKYKYDNTSASQQFSIDAFRFIKENSDNIFIHADLLVCRSDDTESVCAKGCQKTKRRRRAVEEDAVGALLYVGPLQVSQAKSAASATGSSVGTIGAVAASLGALVLALIVVLAILVRRRKASADPKVVFTKIHEEEKNRLV